MVGAMPHRSTCPAAAWLLALAVTQTLRSGLATPYGGLAEEAAIETISGESFQRTVTFQQVFEDVFDDGEDADPAEIQGFLGDCSAHLAPVSCAAVGDPGELLFIRIQGPDEGLLDAALEVLERAGGMELSNYGRLTLADAEGGGEGAEAYAEFVEFEGDYEEIVAEEEELFLQECSRDALLLESGVKCVEVFEGSVVVELESGEKSTLVAVMETIQAEGLILPSFGRLVPIFATETLPSTAEPTGTSMEPAEVEGGSSTSEAEEDAEEYVSKVEFEGDYEGIVAEEEELFLEECTGHAVVQASDVRCVEVFEGSIVVEFESAQKSNLVAVVESIQAEGLYLPSFGRLIPLNVTLTVSDMAAPVGNFTDSGGTVDANGTEQTVLEGMDSSGDTHAFLIVAAISGALGALLFMCLAVALSFWCLLLRHRRRRPPGSEGPLPAPKASSRNNATPSTATPGSESPAPPPGCRVGRAAGEARDLEAGGIITERWPWDSIPEADRCAPSYWENQDLFSSKVSSVQVAPEEMESLQRLVDATFRGTATRDRVGGRMPSGLRIVKAHRIENPSLWKRYVIDRHAIDRKRMSRCTPLSLLQGDTLTSTADPALGQRLRHEVNEAYLWHGTRPASASEIAGGGFRSDRAGTGGSLRGSGRGMYGSGMYFAESSSKSDEYAKDDDEGVHAGLFCLLLCRVTLGEMMHMTAGGEHTHDMIATGLDAGIYDSVLGDRQASVGTYREFVVYEEALAYPEYVIVYERQFRPSSSARPELPV